MNPMGISAPRADSLYTTALKPLKKWPGINPMRLSVSWSNSLDIIAFQTDKLNR